MSWVMVGSAAVSVAGGLLNKKDAPTYIPLEKVDPTEAQANALQGNLQNLQGAIDLSSQSAQASQDIALNLLNQAIPGYSDLVSGLSSIALSNLQNPSEIPQDVLDQTIKRTAELGLGTGITGEAQNFNLARNLGLTSLDVRNQNIGQSQSILSGLAAISPQVSVTSPLSMFMTPAQQAQFQLQQNMAVQQSQQGQADIEANVGNWNSQNLWNSIGGAVGAVTGELSKNNQKNNLPVTIGPIQGAS